MERKSSSGWHTAVCLWCGSDARHPPLRDPATQHCSTVATGWISPLMCVYVGERETEHERRVTQMKMKSQRIRAAATRSTDIEITSMLPRKRKV